MLDAWNPVPPADARGCAVVKKPVDRTLRVSAPIPAITLGGRDRSASARHALWLAIFMRCVAVVWIGEGLLQWMAILTDETGAIIGTASSLHVAALFFFCVLDFVAAVGLWLVASWGSAVWIATIVGHMAAAVFAPGFLNRPTILIGSDIALVGFYAGLAWLASGETRDR